MNAMPGSSTKQRDESPLPLLVLASASPRRREILSGAWSGGFEVLPSGIDEDGPMVGEFPSDYAIRLASAKARNVAAGSTLGLVIAADTVVELDGQPVCKPDTGPEAREMLQELRGRSHSVTTGLAVAAPGFPQILSGHETSEVHMRLYSDDEIDVYVASGEPFDKAGGYAVQDPAFAPAESVRGCYLNVVGLPLCRLSELLAGATPGTRVALRLGSCESCRSPAALREGIAAV
jgi:MAF protein